MILSRAILNSLQVSHKCWSKAQFALLEVPFPPKQGWLKRLEGKFIPDATYQELLKSSHKAKKTQ
jgi:hypothetical protein